MVALYLFIKDKKKANKRGWAPLVGLFLRTTIKVIPESYILSIKRSSNTPFKPTRAKHRCLNNKVARVSDLANKAETI
jgi:hypothetical protein